jgi:hypothetical protein
MDTLHRHMIWHIDEPEAFPFQQQSAEIFRREDQLLSSQDGVARVDRYGTAYAHADRETQERRKDEPTHDISSMTSSPVTPNKEMTSQEK